MSASFPDKKPEVKAEVKAESEVGDNGMDNDDKIVRCENCGVYGMPHKFCQGARFCSKPCVAVFASKQNKCVTKALLGRARVCVCVVGLNSENVVQCISVVFEGPSERGGPCETSASFWR